MKLFAGKCIRNIKGAQGRGATGSGWQHTRAAPAVSLIMNNNAKSWLDLYVDAMMEKDPYKRLAMVRKLRNVQRQGESDEVALDEVPLRRTAKGTPMAARGRRR